MSGYGMWRARLRGEDAPYVDGSFPLGFFRFRDGDGKWYPVAIWQKDSEVWWHRGPDLVHKPAGPDLVFLMGFAYRNPVSEAAYRHWCKSSAWPDDLPPPAGDNLVDGGDDALAKITRTIDAERLEIDRFLKDEITTQEQADKATAWANRLGDLEKDRARDFDAEKAPVRKQAKDIDNRWNVPKADISDLRERLRNAQTPFLITQRRKAQAEEQKRADAQKAAFLANQTQEPAPQQTRPAGTSGTRGRKTRVVDVITGKILDMDKALAALKTHPELIAFVQQLVDRAYAKGVALDGCEKVVTPTVQGG